MRVIDTTVEVAGPDRLRVVTLIDTAPDGGGDLGAIGEGPTGSAVPDAIVRALVRAHPSSVSLKDLHHQLGYPTATINRQAWTLATNAPDLQRRLQGWVTRAGRGRYTLTPAAVARLSDPDCPNFGDVEGVFSDLFKSKSRKGK
jgi:hypothetical protein